MMKKFNEEQVAQAIKNSGGIISSVASQLDCNWNTARSYIQKFGLDYAIEEEKERALDLAESKLMQNIKANDNTCIIFYLKTQGRNRGYIEKRELDINTKQKYDLSKLTDSELQTFTELAMKCEVIED